MSKKNFAFAHCERTLRFKFFTRSLPQTGVPTKSKEKNGFGQNAIAIKEKIPNPNFGPRASFLL